MEEKVEVCQGEMHLRRSRIKIGVRRRRIGRNHTKMDRERGGAEQNYITKGLDFMANEINVSAKVRTEADRGREKVKGILGNEDKKAEHENEQPRSGLVSISSTCRS